MPDARQWPGLQGRRAECRVLDDLVGATRSGHGQALVLRGAAGIGKTALLDHLVARAAGCRVVRTAAAEPERELPYAGLHRLCSPFLDRAAHLPAPQRDALGAAFGVRRDSKPDPLVMGLAVLTLLVDAAAQQPLICVVDDGQWVDGASLQALAFAARRLGAGCLGLVVAVRAGDREPALGGLPELEVRGLARGDAAALLESVVPWPLDARVRDRILTECRGNPLALVELPRDLTATELAFGGAGESRAAVPDGRLEQGFVRQLELLPPQARQLVLAAAAEPVGDGGLLWRAAERLGIGTDAATTAEAGGLLELGDRVRLGHPRVRSAVYRAATPAQRRAVHQALAEATDAELDPDRRAWHRARSAVGTDESIAAELARAADRARSSGGLAAAAAFHEAAAARTPDRAGRARRSLDAAVAKAAAGAFDEVPSLLTVARAGPLDEVGQARTDLLQAEIAQRSGQRGDAVPLLLAAAHRVRPLDEGLARTTYLEALSAAVSAGRLASGRGSALRAVAGVVRAAPAPESPSRTDLLLQGMAVLATDGPAASAPLLRRAVRAFGGAELSVAEAGRAGWVAGVVAADQWDDLHWDLLTQRQLDVVRREGILAVLPLALTSRAVFEVHRGDLSAAASLIAERNRMAEVTGGEPALTRMPEAWLAAVQGRDEAAERLIDDTMADALASGLGATLTMMYAARAVLCNGRGRYEEALAAAREAASGPLALAPAKWALAELVEAGVRCGDIAAAAEACEQLSVMARASGTDLARGVEAGRWALLQDGDGAEALHREAVERLGRTRMRVELARSQLRFGEWLRRRGRRVEARAQLRTAHEALAAMGVDAFAERARRELLATGETVRKRSMDTSGGLTTQEAHIARLAADGLTNPEIATQLYLSPRTVEWHLRKVFTKVGVSTRRQLRRSLHEARTG